MGSAGSLSRHSDEDDIYEDGSQTVVKSIPNEVKPRQRLGRLGLRSVKSLGKSKASSSLRSALSVDFEDPETQKIRRDFEMYKLNKENELQHIQKKLLKFETENRRLRAEVQTLQNTMHRLREERDQAQEGERQSMARAASIEHDKDKIQRQFKIFRETKESELQNLLKARRDLEAKLTKYGHVTREDFDSSSSKMDLSIGGGNPGDWWTVLESEPSMGSTTQLHTASLKGPEYAHTMLEMEGPYVHVNKDDWNAAAASLSQIYPTLPESMPTNVVRIFISATNDAQKETELLIKDFGPKLKKICAQEGRFLNLIHMPCEDEMAYPAQWSEAHIQSRCRQIDNATAFVSFLGEEPNRFTDTDINMGHLGNCGAKPAIFCFRHDPRHGGELADVKKRIKDSGGIKILENYDKPRVAVEYAYHELEKVIYIELGLEDTAQSGGESNNVTDPLDSAEGLCGGCLWDTYYNHEEYEMLASSTRSTCELGFEKLYDKLSEHVSVAGLQPPLLVSGSPGCGKSLLLAKWIELQQQRSNSCLVLYHFVGSSCSIGADPIVMIRRITAQLMQYVTTPPALSSDPVRLVEEFPKWLEKVSAKVSGGIILVLDSADRFQNGESQLKFLLDPLPVDLRVVISVDKDTCPTLWKSWPKVHITSFTNKNAKELLRAELASFGLTLANELESLVLTHCRTPQTCNPLYVVILASDLAKCSSEEKSEKQLEVFLQTPSTVELYKCVLDQVRIEFESQGNQTKGMIRKILQLIFSSRNGLSELELFGLLPGLTWNFLCPVCDALEDRYILTYRAGLLTFAHEDARKAVEQKLFTDPTDKTLVNMRCMLREYWSKFTMPGDATYRVSDELPWLSWQLEDKEGLYRNVLDLCVFVKLYGRGRCAELIGYWQYLGVDKITMSEAYYKAMKMMEGMVGQFNGLVTLPRIADVYEALGRFLRDLNLLTEALTPLQRSLELREMALDPDHPAVGQSLHQVAGIHAQQGKFSTAEQIYRQALEIFETAYGTNHYLVAREIDALAVLYQKQGKHELADPLHKRATSIRKKSKAPRAINAQRDHDPLKKRTLQLEELATKDETPELARTLNEIGVLYYLQNNIDVAETFFQRTLEVRENLLGPDHPDVAQSLNNLAALWFDRKQYERAKPMYERALEIRKSHFPPGHPSIMSVVKHLGMLCKKTGNLAEAVPLYKEMLSVRELSFGTTHPSVATAIVNLAVLYSQQGNHESALPLYENALTIYKDSLGSHHPRVAETLQNLALLKYELGEYEVAAELYKRCNEIKELGPVSSAELNRLEQGGGASRATRGGNGAGGGIAGMPLYLASKKPPSSKSSTDDSASTLRNTRTIHIEPLPPGD